MVGLHSMKKTVYISFTIKE